MTDHSKTKKLAERPRPSLPRRWQILLHPWTLCGAGALGLFGAVLYIASVSTYFDDEPDQLGLETRLSSN